MNLQLKLVEVEDAKFIMDLRQKMGNFLSVTSSDLSNQIEWIGNYKDRENEKKEFYFIISDEKFNKYGTVRLYNIDYTLKEFEWGSWILNNDRPEGFSYLSLISSFEYAFNELGLEKALVNVRKENHKAAHIYRKVGMKQVHDDGTDIFLEYTRQNFEGYVKSINNKIMTDTY